MSQFRRYKFTPTYRSCEEPIYLVTCPGKAYFDTLTKIHEGRQGARFALMTDGELWFGDAWTVLHEDMMRFVSPSKASPILIGVFLRSPRTNNQWQVYMVQWFMGMKVGERHAAGLLRHHTDWAGAVEAMGSDPFDLPTVNEEFFDK